MSEAHTSNTSQAITDDQDLAQVLAANNTESGGLQFEASPLPGAAPAVPAAATTTEPTVAAPAADDSSSLTAALDEAVQSLPDPTAAPAAAPVASAAPALAEPPAEHGAPHTGSADLDTLKKDALEELRPLVDKLDLKPDEKFDTLLLIIRSTDDKSLLAPAHEAAKAIEDDTKRAQALLDVIKEIDYFSSQAA